MLFYGVADDVEIFAQPAVGAFLVLPGEAGVTRHIRIENGGELVGQAIFHSVVPFFELGLSGNTIAGTLGWRVNGSNEGQTGRLNLSFPGS